MFCLLILILKDLNNLHYNLVMLFIDYIHDVESNNLYPKHAEKYQSYTSHRVLFFYGPSGTGKYSQALYFLKKTTGSTLQYERKNDN